MTSQSKPPQTGPNRWSTLFGRADPGIARARLRETIATRSRWGMIVPAVFDVLSARVAEKAGFDTVVLSGYGVSVSRLGLPDSGFIELSDISEVVRTIAARTPLAVIADCDTGYGNALNAMRAAEEMIAVGAAAFFIEDQLAPKRSGHMQGKVVVSAAEYTGKLRAIDRVRRELAPEIVVIARSDMRGVAGASIDDVVERGIRYADAGADVFFPEGLLSLDELARCAERVPIPMLYNMNGISPVIPAKQLAEANVAFVVAGEAMRPALVAMTATFEKLRDRGMTQLDKTPTFDLHGFAGFAEAAAWEKQFLSAELAEGTQ